MRTFLLLAAAVLVASTAHAQNPTPAPTTGPLVLERIHDAWIVAPDFKVTDLDDRTGELAGAWLICWYYGLAASAWDLAWGFYPYC